MKLTKLFSHACDEGGNVTRSYVKVFTNSRKCDFQRYYNYLYKNKMFSELNNLTQAMKMFGFFGRFMDWIAPGISSTYRNAKMGVEMGKLDKVADRVTADRSNRTYDVNDLIQQGDNYFNVGNDGKVHLDNNLQKIAYKDSVDPYKASTEAYKSYQKDPNRGRSGSVQSAIKDIPTESDMLMDNDILAKQSLQQYGRDVVTLGKAGADRQLQNELVKAGLAPRVINTVGANGKKMKITVNPKK